MICLDIETSDGRRHRIGVEDGVASALVNVITLPGSPAYNPQVPETAPVQLSLSGFGPDQQRLHWGEVTMPLLVGDAVQIRVVETPSADPPTHTPILPELPDEAA